MFLDFWLAKVKYRAGYVGTPTMLAFHRDPYFSPRNSDDVTDSPLLEEAGPEGFKYLLSMKMWSLTENKVEARKNAVDALEFPF